MDLLLYIVDSSFAVDAVGVQEQTKIQSCAFEQKLDEIIVITDISCQSRHLMKFQCGIGITKLHSEFFRLPKACDRIY